MSLLLEPSHLHIRCKTEGGKVEECAVAAATLDWHWYLEAVDASHHRRRHTIISSINLPHKCVSSNILILYDKVLQPTSAKPKLS
jgi:hypothetical protein